MSLLHDYSRVVDILGDMLMVHETANAAYTVVGHEALAREVTQASPETAAMLHEAERELSEGSGATVLHETGVDKLDDEHAQSEHYAYAQSGHREVECDLQTLLQAHLVPQHYRQ